MSAVSQQALLMRNIPKTVTYIGNAGTGDNQTTYTFTNWAATSANAGVLVVGFASTSTSATFNSGTINGNACHICGTITDGGVPNIGMMSIVHPGGNIGNVTGTWSAGQTRCGSAIWLIEGVSDAVQVNVQGAANANPTFPTLTTLIGGVAIGFASSNGATSVWTGLNEDFDSTYDTIPFTGAHITGIAGTSLNISIANASAAQAGIVASW